MMQEMYGLMELSSEQTTNMNGDLASLPDS